MSAATTPLAKRRPVIRVVLVLVTLLTAWQVFAQFLWIAPASALRELVPGNLLMSWQIPWFGQSWSVFAPDPINGNYHLKVRALVKDASGSTSRSGSTRRTPSTSCSTTSPPAPSGSARLGAGIRLQERVERPQRAPAGGRLVGLLEGQDPEGRFERALRDAAHATRMPRRPPVASSRSMPSPSRTPPKPRVPFGATTWFVCSSRSTARTRSRSPSGTTRPRRTGEAVRPDRVAQSPS